MPLFFVISESAQSTGRMSKNGSSLGYTPDLTSGVHLHVSNSNNDYNFSYSDKNSNCSSGKGNSGINGMSTPIPMAPFSEFRPISEHFYEQPMVPILQKSTTPDVEVSHEKAPFLMQAESCSSSGQPSPTTTFSGNKVDISFKFWSLLLK